MFTFWKVNQLDKSEVKYNFKYYIYIRALGSAFCIYHLDCIK